MVALTLSNAVCWLWYTSSTALSAVQLDLPGTPFWKAKRAKAYILERIAGRVAAKRDAMLGAGPAMKRSTLLEHFMGASMNHPFLLCALLQSTNSWAEDMPCIALPQLIRTHAHHRRAPGRRRRPGHALPVGALE